MDTSLLRYIARINAVQPLSQEQELVLARRWREHGDWQARNQLMRAHLGFVVSIARRHQRRRGSSADVVAEGNLGLLYAADEFQPELGHRCATYDAMATLEQLGAEFGASRERVRQLDARLKRNLASRLLCARDASADRRVRATAA